MRISQTNVEQAFTQSQHCSSAEERSDSKGGMHYRMGRDLGVGMDQGGACPFRLGPEIISENNEQEI
jgi:hypothetical protein